MSYSSSQLGAHRRGAFSRKVSQLMHEGYPQKQAVAIAYSERRRGGLGAVGDSPGSWLEGFAAVAAAHPITATEAVARAREVRAQQVAQAAYVDAEGVPPLPVPEDNPSLYRAGSQALTRAFSQDVGDHFWAQWYADHVWVTQIDSGGFPAGTRVQGWGNTADYDGIRARVNSYVFGQAARLAREAMAAAGETPSETFETNVAAQQEAYKAAEQPAITQEQHIAEVQKKTAEAAAQFAQEQAARVAAQEEAARAAAEAAAAATPEGSPLPSTDTGGTGGAGGMTFGGGAGGVSSAISGLLSTTAGKIGAAALALLLLGGRRRK